MRSLNWVRNYLQGWTKSNWPTWTNVLLQRCGTIWVHFHLVYFSAWIKAQKGLTSWRIFNGLKWAFVELLQNMFHILWRCRFIYLDSLLTRLDDFKSSWPELFILFLSILFLFFQHSHYWVSTFPSPLPLRWKRGRLRYLVRAEFLQCRVLSRFEVRGSLILLRDL